MRRLQQNCRAAPPAAPLRSGCSAAAPLRLDGRTAFRPRAIRPHRVGGAASPHTRIPTARFRPDRRPVCSRRRAAPAPVLRFSSAHAPAAAGRAAFAAADGAAAPRRPCYRSAARAFAPDVQAARPAAVPVPDCVQSDSLPWQSTAPCSAARAAPCGGSRQCSPRASPPSPSPAAASADGRLTFVRSRSAKAELQTSG